MRLFERLRALGAGLGAMATAACATVAPEAPATAEARPALWKVADADTTIYLFGTIHLLPKDVEWRSAALDAAIGAADEIVFETVLGDDPKAAAQMMMTLGVSPGLPPLAERVPADKRARLEEMIAASRLPRATLDRMETWAAALTLTAASFRSMGFLPEQGVERGLKADLAAGKSVSGLETVEQQFALFDTLSEDAQRTFLADTVSDPGAARREFEAMLAAWRTGDVAAIARTFDSETALSPELRAALMTRRNQAWAEWIDTRLDRPGTVLVAVGAGHLAGRDSVQAMLATKGLEASRVQ